MSENELLDILSYWSYWEKDVPDYVGRLVTLPQEMSNKLALVIQGVRRSGKSTLLVQIMEQYKLNPKNCIFINFEDPKLENFLNTETLDQVVKLSEKERKGGKIYFFFDEIQNVTNWEKWLHTRLERPGKNHFIITGSNANLLSGELSTSLTGRFIGIELYPFSYLEKKSVIKNLNLETHLRIGGFPALLNYNEPEKLLKQYFDDVIEKDIRNRLGARQSSPIRKTLLMAFETCGSELSLRRIAGSVNISVDTVSSYLEAAFRAYMLFPCQFFAPSLRKREGRNKKYYPIDTGLRKSVVSKSGADLGKMLEANVFLELKKRYGEVFYWKDKFEVDFVIEDSKGITPFQVTWDEPLKRHLDAEIEFYENFPKANQMIYVTKSTYEAFLSEISEGS